MEGLGVAGRPGGWRPPGRREARPQAGRKSALEWGLQAARSPYRWRAPGRHLRPQAAPRHKTGPGDRSAQGQNGAPGDGGLEPFPVARSPSDPPSPGGLSGPGLKTDPGRSRVDLSPGPEWSPRKPAVYMACRSLAAPLDRHLQALSPGPCRTASRFRIGPRSAQGQNDRPETRHPPGLRATDSPSGPPSPGALSGPMSHRVILGSLG